MEPGLYEDVFKIRNLFFALRFLWINEGIYDKLNQIRIRFG